MPLSCSFSSVRAALVISVSSVWHANEVSVLMLEHYRYVCLIPLLPFLFLEIILFLNGIGIFRFPQLLLEPTGWSNSQPTFQSLIPTPLPFKCSQQYDSWLEQPLFASLCVCLCECACYDYMCNGSECTHEYVFYLKVWLLSWKACKRCKVPLCSWFHRLSVRQRGEK